MDRLIAAARSIEPVGERAATAYAENSSRLVLQVNRLLDARPDLEQLLGQAPRRVMYDNHRNHAQFMATVFALNDFGLLARTVPWVYRAYGSRGFSHDYFPAVLGAWVQAIEEQLPAELAAELSAVYRWMLAHHADFIAVADRPLAPPPPVAPDWAELEQRFLDALLAGDSARCLELAGAHIVDRESQVQFAAQVVHPALYEVGELWETGKISVAREHLASAIVTRVIASQAGLLGRPTQQRGRAIVTAAPNELHQIGALIVASMLENEGFDVAFLGASTPVSDVLSLARELQPVLLALSVAMPFNLEGVRRLVELMRADEDLRQTRIVIGGFLFSHQPQLAESLGADGYATELADARELVRRWFPR